MGKASRRKREEEQKRLYFEIRGDARSNEEKDQARAMLDALQQKLVDDALREDGFYFLDRDYEDCRRPRFTAGIKSQSYTGHKRWITDSAVVNTLSWERSERGEGVYVVTFAIDSICVWHMKSGECIGSLDVSEFQSMSVVGSAQCNGVSGRTSLLIAYATHQHPRVQRFSCESRTFTGPRGPTSLTASDATPFDPCHVDFGHQQQITCVEFNHQARILATGSLDSTCILWEVSVDGGEQYYNGVMMICILPVFGEGVCSCRFTHDGQELITASGDCSVKLWSVGELECTSLQHERRQWERAIPFSLTKDRCFDALLFDDSLPMLIANDDWVHGERQYCLHKSEVLWLPPERISSKNTLDKDGCRENAASDDIVSSGTRDVDPESARPFLQAERENVVLQGPGTAESAEELGPEKPISRVESLRKEYEKLEHFDFEKLLNPAASLVALSEDESRTNQPINRPMITVDERLLFEFQRRKADGNYAAHTSRITGSAIAKEMDIAVTVSLDRSIILWSLSQRQVLHISRDTHSRPITCCALTSPLTSPPGFDTLLATGGSDNLVKVWCLRVVLTDMIPTSISLDCVYTLAGHFDRLSSLVFDASGIFLVSTSDDTLAHCWRVRPASPDAPEQPHITKVDRFSVAITWKEPLANGSALEKYVIHTAQLTSFYGPEDLRVIPDTIVAPKHTIATIDNLQPGIQYQFQISAVNGVGRSKWSEPSEKVETLAFSPSKIGQSVQYSDVAPTTLRLTWKSPSPNGATISSYTLQCLPERREFVPLRELRVTTDELEVMPPVESSTVTSRRVPKPLAAPKAKKKKKGKVEGKEEKNPIKTPSQLIQGAHRAGTQYAFTAHGLWPGEIYQFVVAAENRCGLGEFSPFSDYVKMEPTAPDAPAAPMLTSIDKRSAEVTWVKPRCNGSEILQYTLYWTQQDEQDDPSEGNQLAVLERDSVTLLTKSIVGTTYTLQNLQPGRPLQVWVAASNLVNNVIRDSALSESCDVARTLCDVPDKPECPRLISSSSHSMVIQVTPPCDNGDCITKYQVMLFHEEMQFGVVTKSVTRQLELPPDEMQRGTEQQQGSDPSNKNEVVVLAYTILELRANTLYSASVSAVNALGSSTMSDCSTPVRTRPPTVPATIRKPPVVSDIEPTRAQITWTLPAHNGGTPISTIVLQYSIDGGAFEHEIIVFQGKELLLEHLHPRRTYQFRVTTSNKVGRAPWSRVCPSFTTPSLVGFTISTYFASRPEIEHVKATVLQRRYRLWVRRREERAAFIEGLTLALAHWHIL